MGGMRSILSSDLGQRLALEKNTRQTVVDEDVRR